MNENTIETILRHSPRVHTPADLLEKLTGDIQLPGQSAEPRSVPMGTSRPSSNGLRRWLPALGFALWFLGCIVVFGIQASRMAELREQHRVSESVKAVAAQQAIAAEAAHASAAAELERLKKDLADMQRLRAEAQQLRVGTQELTALRLQNQQLREELRSQTAPLPKPEEDFFAVAQAREVHINCIGNLKLVGLAARMWANKSKTDRLPDRATLQTSLANFTYGGVFHGTKILYCPRDGTAFDILSPGAPENRPEVVYARCPVHNNACMVDGSGQNLGTKFRVVQQDGQWLIQKADQ